MAAYWMAPVWELVIALQAVVVTLTAEWTLTAAWAWARARSLGGAAESGPRCIVCSVRAAACTAAARAAAACSGAVSCPAAAERGRAAAAVAPAATCQSAHVRAAARELAVWPGRARCVRRRRRAERHPKRLRTAVPEPGGAVRCSGQGTLAQEERQAGVYDAGARGAAAAVSGAAGPMQPARI